MYVLADWLDNKGMAKCCANYATTVLRVKTEKEGETDRKRVQMLYGSRGYTRGRGQIGRIRWTTWIESWGLPCMSEPG